MYDRMRNAFIGKLYDLNLSEDETNAIITALDAVSKDFTISEMCTALTVRASDRAIELVKNFLISKKVESRSELTIKHYYYTLNDFAKSLQTEINDLTANDLRLYLHEYKKKKEISDRSLESIRVILSSFFKWMMDEEYITKNPMAKIAPIKYEVKPRKALDLFKVEELRKACKDARELCIVEVLYSTACRVTELCNIKLSDVDFVKKEIHLFGKGKKHRTAYINARAELAIKDYLEKRRHDSEYLLCNDRGGGQMHKENIEKMFRDFAKRLGLEGKLTPHVMRHTTATIAVKHGMNINEVQRMLGHENIATTMIYAETDDDSVKRDHERCIV